MIRLEDVLKTFFKTSWRRFEDVLKMSWRRFCKTSWRRLENVLKTSWRRLENVLKTYDQDEYVGLDEDVFWRRMSKANIFVLIKTSSEDEDERRLQDVFIKSNVWWVVMMTEKKITQVLRTSKVKTLIWHFLLRILTLM